MVCGRRAQGRTHGAIRIQLQRADRLRDLALFNLAIDSKLRSCDLFRLRVSDVAHGTQDGGANRGVNLHWPQRAPTRRSLTGQKLPLLWLPWYIVPSLGPWSNDRC